MNTIEDAKQFIKECVDYLGVAFHPDTDFIDYKDTRTNETLYNNDSAVEASNKLQIAFEIFEVNGEDIYTYAASLL